MTTRTEVIRIRQDNPQAREVDIARQLGITREGARYWLVKLQLPTKFPIVRPVCPCGKVIWYGSHLCKECWSKYHRVTLICFMCVKQYSITKSDFKQRLKAGYKYNFCGHKCEGLYLGKTHKTGRKKK